MKKTVMTVIVSLAVAAIIHLVPGSAGDANSFIEPMPVPTSPGAASSAQAGCPIIFPDGPLAVAPNQPAVQNQSTIGIINALCDVTLDFIGCGFTPSSVTLGCDTNGDGVSDMSIPLKDINPINRILFHATIPVFANTPGTAFPLVCCGGMTTITLSRTVTAGDNNVFGTFTQTIVCSIDLGIRAPVVISATPAEEDCSAGENQLIPGACFVVEGGKPNVTSVFGVEVGNSNNIVQAETIHILSPNLIDAFFRPGLSQAGKTFLLYARGPNGTSRNLTDLPALAPAGCPLGNELGVTVTFRCKSTGPNEVVDPPPSPQTSSCTIERSDVGAFSLILTGRFRDGGSVTIDGVRPKKMKLKDFDPAENIYSRMILKGRLCDNLPGNVVYVDPDGSTSSPFFCLARCAN